MGLGSLWRGVGLQHTQGLFGPSVNRWSIKRSPNDTKLDMRSTGSKPRPLGKVSVSSFLSCVGIKHFRIGPRLAKRPWFTTGRPPVKFRTIWTSFDTPTVN